MKYLSVEEMVAVEREANASGLTYELMMENAGRNLAIVVHEVFGSFEKRTVLGLVGSGNNGGDTLVALALLAEWGWSASACIVRPRPAEDALTGRLLQAGGEVYSLDDDLDFQRLAGLIQANQLLLDGVLGTGMHLPLKKDVAHILDFVRQSVASTPHIHVVAVDCPSGVDCDTGEAAPECIPAELTITMAAVKRGLLKFPAYNLVGRLQLVGIGLGEDAPYPEAWEKVTRRVVDNEDVQNVLPKRPLDAHKGTFGTALIVAGSLNYTGAAFLAGMAAYRIGVGLVTLAVPEPLHVSLAGQFPEATWLLLPHEMGVIADEAWSVVQSNVERATALLVGPGFGLEDTTRDFLSDFLRMGPPPKRSTIGFAPAFHSTEGKKPASLPPLVIDADGLKLLARLPDWPRQLPALTVLTPHPGEMAVLTGLTKDEIQQDRLAIAEKYAKEWGHVVVLKGAFTVIAAPDGQTAIISVASPALARAGTGDVLAGLIVGLRAQGVEAFQAAMAGAWIHAQAGLQAARVIGSTASVLAGDVLAAVPLVVKELN
jgi:ADP-dependent NAD(P)H-hydrate dehydratase / NAD(P)H-hydrate epimerase